MYYLPKMDIPVKKLFHGFEYTDKYMPGDIPHAQLGQMTISSEIMSSVLKISFAISHLSTFCRPDHEY